MSATASNSSPETCAWCAGTGRRAVSLGYVASCLVCGGKGHVTVKQPAGQCQQCGGSGHRNAASPCLYCAGTGWALAFGQT
ncbi:MAG: transcriptional regulator [Pyrinomonadaceae bacterium]|nr:transcriptional regulator [Pyrinomonadaceae bacterium]